MLTTGSRLITRQLPFPHLASLLGYNPPTLHRGSSKRTHRSLDTLLLLPGGLRVVIPEIQTLQWDRTQVHIAVSDTSPNAEVYPDQCHT